MDTESKIDNFLNTGFAKKHDLSFVCEKELQLITQVLEYVNSNIAGVSRPRKYVLGLALDFTLLAQRLSNIDSEAKVFRPNLTESSLFNRYTLVLSRAGTQANTLTLVYNGQSEGIRKLEERVGEFFHSLNRTGYPSAYVYTTGQWHKYKDLLTLCFKISENGRYHLCRKLIDYGFSIIPAHTYFGRKKQRVRVFEQVLVDYPRTDVNENGGLVFQSIAHGFIAADRPHLAIIADKVRTGSARQKRFGDIDCYYGLDIELSVEVKDLDISSSNFKHQLSGFINDVLASGAQGMVFVRNIDLDIRVELESDGIVVMSLSEALAIVKAWDWQKQNNALQVMLHHISHIEQNTEATQRLLRFIATSDQNHDSLEYAQKKNAS